jgi:ribosomal protein S18 acetylase RimI-like enzyme
MPCSNRQFARTPSTIKKGTPIHPPQTPPPMSPESLLFRTADPPEAHAIAALINAAFRSEPSGQTWLTNDQNQRTDMLSVEQVEATLANPETPILVGTLADSHSRPTITALCLLRAPENRPSKKTTTTMPGIGIGVPATSCAWLRMLAVDPRFHRRGYGAIVLRRAEVFAREEWEAGRLELNVVNARVELRAWYGKHGFQETGRVMEFPYGNHRDGLLAEGLELVVLGKNLTG